MTTTSRVTLMGIDPGYDRIGWAVGAIDQGKLQLYQFGCIETTKKASLIARYQEIDQQLTQILIQYQPREAGVESLFFYNNQTTAMHVSEARGVIISCLFRHAVAFAEYTPLQIKQAVTGDGRADKAAVEKMVKLQLVAQTQVPAKTLDDTMDAMAILLTHAASRKINQQR